MGYFKSLGLLIVLALPVTSRGAGFTVIAYDDASDAAYTPMAPYASLNGGFGLDPWLHSVPVGPLHAYVSSSTGNDPAGPPLTNIDTGGLSWGNNADPTGNTFTARRNLSVSNPLPVGGTFSISYDNGNVDGQETISWGLNNNVMCQFFFNPFIPNYQFTDVLSATTIVTPIAQDWGGVRLKLTRDTASTYSFEVKRLSDNFTFGVGPFAYNTTAIAVIRTINITNTDGGAGGGHAMFVNSIEATAVPEPGSLLAGLAVGAGAILQRRTARRGS